DVHSFVRHLIAQRLKLETRWPLSDHIKDLVHALGLLSSVLSELDAKGARDAALAETIGAHIERNGTAVPMPRKTAEKYASAVYKTRMAALEAAGSQQEGDAWRALIRRLRNILKEAGLPAGVSKAPNYPLFRFVSALNEDLPRDRRKTGSLADAIYDERVSRRNCFHGAITVRLNTRTRHGATSTKLMASLLQSKSNSKMGLSCNGIGSLTTAHRTAGKRKSLKTLSQCH